MAYPVVRCLIQDPCFCEEEEVPMKTKTNNTVKNRDNFFLLFCGVWYAYHSCHGSIILPVCSLETPVQREGAYSPYNSPSRVYDSHIRRSYSVPC